MLQWLRPAAVAAVVGVVPAVSAADPPHLAPPAPSVTAAPTLADLRPLTGAGSMPPVVPAGLATEPVGEVLDLTPPTLPGRSEHAHPAKHHHHDHSGGLFASGEYLLWRPRLGDSAFALIDPANDLTPAGRVKDVPLGTRSGFRANLGYKLPGSGWAVGVTYTHLLSTGRETVAAPAGGVLYPLLTRPGIVDRAASAVGTGRVKYDAFDLDISRTTEIDEHVALRSFAGVRFTDLDTDLGSTYDGLLARNSAVQTNSGFQGVGPTAGAEATWLVGHGLNLFGNARGGLLYGTFDGRARETNAAGAVNLADVTDRFSGLAPVVAVGLGGSFQFRGITVAGGYEVTHYFGVVSRPTFTDDFAEGRVARRRSDLSFDGIFIRVGAAY
jgi:hypothetical protein